MTESLNAVSFLSPGHLDFYQEIARQFAAALNVPYSLVTQGAANPLQDQALINDEVDVAFICGLPLNRLERIHPGQLVPIAAPVMHAARYENRPIYFSDVIVRADTSFVTFDDLTGSTFCYNDPDSHSGYNAPRYRLIEGGCTRGFFGAVNAVGSHLNAIDGVASDQADCAAVDSTVLEYQLSRKPELAQRLRVVESLGPYTNPPIVAAIRLGKTMLSHLTDVVLSLDRAMLQKVGIDHYVPVTLADYAQHGAMYDAAVQQGFTTIR